MRTTINEAEIRRRARLMSDEGLVWSDRDARIAAEAVETIERAGCVVDKTSGYYRDEAAVYRDELRQRKERAARLAKALCTHCGGHVFRRVSTGLPLDPTIIACAGCGQAKE